MSYLRHARRRSRSSMSKYSSSCSQATVEIQEFTEPADEPARIGDVVGDADAIEAAPAVKINHLRQREAAVGVIGMDVEIAKLDARGRRQTRPDPPFRRGGSSKSLTVRAGA